MKRRGRFLQAPRTGRVKRASKSKLERAWTPACAGVTFVATSRFTMRAGSMHALIPAPRAPWHHCAASLPATGRGWAHSPSHVAAAGAWKESPDGSRSRRPDATVAGQGASNGAACRRPPDCGLKVRRRRLRQRGRAGSQSVARGTQNRRTRVPQGSPGTRAGSQGARRGSQEGLQPRPPGPARTRPRVADEAPAYPSHLPALHRRGRTARACPAERSVQLDFACRRSHFRNNGHHPRQAPPAPREGPQARHAGAAQAGLDPGEGAGVLAAVCRDARASCASTASSRCARRRAAPTSPSAGPAGTPP